jgi:HPt (histidine-containing phosphotransfer) domain-containing protein
VGSETFDQEKMLQQVGGNQALAAKLVALVVKSIPELISQFKTAQMTNDLVVAEKMSHRLVSLLGQVGGTSLSQHFSATNQKIRQGSMPNINEEVEGQVAELLSTLEEWLGEYRVRSANG